MPCLHARIAIDTKDIRMIGSQIGMRVQVAKCVCLECGVESAVFRGILHGDLYEPVANNDSVYELKEVESGPFESH